MSPKSNSVYPSIYMLIAGFGLAFAYSTWTSEGPKTTTVDNELVAQQAAEMNRLAPPLPEQTEQGDGDTPKSAEEKAGRTAKAGAVAKPAPAPKKAPEASPPVTTKPTANPAKREDNPGPSAAANKGPAIIDEVETPTPAKKAPVPAADAKKTDKADKAKAPPKEDAAKAEFSPTSAVRILDEPGKSGKDTKKRSDETAPAGPESEPVKPEVVSATDFKVWVKLGATQTKVFEKGDHIPGLGEFLGAVEGTPKFSPISAKAKPLE